MSRDNSNSPTSVKNLEDVQLNIDWDDVVCPICLDIPHNSVLLQCSSYDKGCRALVCDTNQSHSNCLDRFKTARGMPPYAVSDTTSVVDIGKPLLPEVGLCNLTCPLCRGQVSGLIVVDKARTHLDEKKRCCDEVKCTFMGSYLELQKHVQLEHPHACPSKIDPARVLDWENFQQSSETIDVLSTIHSEIQHHRDTDVEMDRRINAIYQNQLDLANQFQEFHEARARRSYDMMHELVHLGRRNYDMMQELEHLRITYRNLLDTVRRSTGRIPTEGDRTVDASIDREA